MIDKLYKDISDRLAAEVPELRWIELEYGQLEIPEENYPCQFPCCLIDFPSMEFQNETHGNQQGMITVQLRLAFDMYEDLMVIDGQGVPDQAAALQHLNTINKVHKAMHGFETDYFTPMVRMYMNTERRDDGIKVFAFGYGFAAKDDTAAKVYNRYTGADLQVEETN